MARFLVFVALLAGGWITAAAQNEDLGSPRLRIEWADFKTRYDEKRIVVIDVRAADAFELGHIPGALSIPLDTLDKRVGDLRKLKKPLVTYCA